MDIFIMYTTTATAENNMETVEQIYEQMEDALLDTHQKYLSLSDFTDETLEERYAKLNEVTQVYHMFYCRIHDAIIRWQEAKKESHLFDWLEMVDAVNDENHEAWERYADWWKDFNKNISGQSDVWGEFIEGTLYPNGKENEKDNKESKDQQ